MAAWSFIVAVITQRDQFSQWLREAQVAELEALQPRRDELDNIEALIAAAEQEAGELATAMRHARGLVSRKMEAQADEINQRYNKLVESRNRIQAELEAAELTDETLVDFMQFAESVIEGLNDPTFEQKRRWLGYMRVKINVADKVATISCRFPVKPKVIDLRSSKIT